MFSSQNSQVSSDANYIEDVFSTYLWTGNNAQQTITNGTDLSGKGGLVWVKNRTSSSSNELYDTVRGATKRLVSNSTAAQSTDANGVKSFSSTGFVAGTSISVTGENYVSWTFREQPKFFDVVTYTGNGANRTIAHNLGSVPGCIMVKRTNTTGDWQVYHRSLANTQYMVLNAADAATTGATRWNSTTPTSTVFSLGTDASVNASGSTYVAYLFAHDAGGFGLTGTDNVISCGSYTGNGTGGDTGGPIVTLGYEPQWVLIKNYSASNTNSWVMMDTMRGLQYGNDSPLWADLSDAEQVAQGNYITPLADGFQLASSSGGVNNLNKSFIYIAIRRGPMKVPTSGTSVFAPVAATAPSSPYTVTTNFPVDLTINSLSNTSSGKNFNDRLRGGTTTSYVALDSTGLAAEATGTGFGIGFNSNTSIIDNGWESGTGNNAIWWNFRRAPSYFDEVCYTGNRVSGSTTQTLTHNLGTTPELMIVKGRSTSYDWFVYSATLGATKYLSLRSTIASTTTVNPNSYWNETAPTSTQFTVGANNNINGSGVTFVAYLFATCAGVSKVGSYTGTGATQTISCGFTGGARFVLVKRVDSTGDWYVWDTARGIVSGNDPYLLLNSTAAEVTSTDYIDTYSAGFEISSTAPAAINASGGTFIFLAIA